MTNPTGVAQNRSALPGERKTSGPELSVVIPCLNEAASIELVVRKAVETMAAAGIEGEVVVADNGSTDGSGELAREAGARVIPDGGRRRQLRLR